MTEQGWLNATDAWGMMQFLRSTARASDRKLRLFSCACCRRVWAWYEFRQEENREAVAASERYADGLATLSELTAARRAASERVPDGLGQMVAGADAAVWYAASLTASETASGPWPFAGQAGLVHDLFGNPFRPLPPVTPSLLGWNSCLVRTLAQAAYDDRHLPSGHLDRVRLAILADALADAGCTDAGLLAHLRAEGPHVRGCWALDLLLGKS